MKNGRNGSCIASAKPVKRALSPARLIVVIVGSQAPRDRVDVIDRDDPAEQPVAAGCEACEEATAELRACRLLRIGDSQQLEIATAERHDPVARPEPLVAPTAASHEPELAFDPGGRRIKVRGSVDHMIDPHGLAKLPGPCACACAARSCRA